MNQKDSNENVEVGTMGDKRFYKKQIVIGNIYYLNFRKTK